MKNKNKNKNTSVFDVDGVPPLSKAIPLSLQHVFSMLSGSVTMAIIIGTAVGLASGDMVLLVQTSLIFAAITTLIQLYPIGKFGSRLPIIYGGGFTFIPTYVSLAHFGMPTIMGAQIIGGIVSLVNGSIIKKVRKYLPPIVTGSVVFTLGLTLYPIAIDYMAGGAGSPDFGSATNWIIAIISLVTVIICNHFGKGILKISGVFVGIVVGYVCALFANIVDFAPVREAGWLAFPKPFHFGLEFNIAAIIPAIIIFLVNDLQSMGDLSATTMGGLDRDITDEELSGGLLGHGVSSILSGIFGSMATSSYSQNVGMICLNKVVSRFVLAVAAVIILLCGLIPKFGALMLTIPYCVLGGATMTIFAMITMTGIRLILEEEFTERNVAIVGLAVALGMGITAVPESLNQFPQWVADIFASAPYVLAAFVAFILNLIIPKTTLEEEANEKLEIEANYKPDQL